MVENKKDIEELKKLLKKCLSPVEKPVHPSYVHEVVKKTHEIKGAHRIWTIAQTHHLTFNRFSIWHFCQLMHKVLNGGHKQVLSDSLCYKPQLEKYGQYWSTQQTDDMSACIAWYCQVLCRKLSFHKTHPHISGNLCLEYEPSMDLNSIFQFCLDVLDYLEDLLSLQYVILTNVPGQQISPTSKKGICRLAPLATIIAECHSLYQHSVDVLRLLHSELSLDDISGLRKRFNLIFDGLKQFYEHVRRQQLPLDSVAIPHLPMFPPNLYASATAAAVTGKHHEPSAPLITDMED